MFAKLPVAVSSGLLEANIAASCLHDSYRVIAYVPDLTRQVLSSGTSPVPSKPFARTPPSKPTNTWKGSANKLEHGCKERYAASPRLYNIKW
eukprot:4463343-Amphidinium_carterae.1